MSRRLSQFALFLSLAIAICAAPHSAHAQGAPADSSFDAYVRGTSATTR